MANNHCCDQKKTKVEIIALEDGRRAEKHTSYDENGNEVVEIFSEEKRPVKLEKRIIREHKQIVAKERHQIVKDGDVVFEETIALEPEVPLQIRERIAVADHAKIIDGDYVRKDEVTKLIREGVVAGVQALMDNVDVAEDQPEEPSKMMNRPTARQIVENNVSDKKKNEMAAVAVLGFILLAQMGFVVYLLLGS